MVILNIKNSYSRYDNILYENDIPILKFINNNFCNWGPLSSVKQYMSLRGVKYMQSYINANMGNVEKIERVKLITNGQIELW